MRALLFAVFSLTMGIGVSAQSRGVAILDVRTNAVLGGVKDGRFVKPQEAVKGLKLGDPFTYFGIDSLNLGGRKLVKLESPGAYCADTFLFEALPGETSGILVSSHVDWDVSVRFTENLWDGYQPSWAELKYWRHPAYEKAVSDFLKSKGITNAVTRISQAFRGDLDGDRQDEVIFVANHFNHRVSPQGRVGDYSVVLLRKVIGKVVKDILIDGDLDYKNFPAGGPLLRDITAIVDLDGDGVMEIVVHEIGDRRASTAVYSIRHLTPSRVLQVSCGL
jgi:hypothetical protein